MLIAALDSETECFRPGCMAPPMVCLTYQLKGPNGKGPAQIVHVQDAKPHFVALLNADVIIGQNVAYDMAVFAAQWPDLIPAIFKAYDQCRVTDTMIRQQLADISGGVFRGYTDSNGKSRSYRYNLEALADRLCGIRLRKDAWRTSYGAFLDVPLSGWVDKARELQGAFKAEAEAIIAKDPNPKDKPTLARLKALTESIEADAKQCLEYPLDDARATMAVWEAQEAQAHYLKDQYRQTYAAFALHLSSAWGLRTAEVGVADLRARIESTLADLEGRMRDAGFVRPDGTKDMGTVKRRMFEHCTTTGRVVPQTDAHYKVGADGSRVCPHDDGKCPDHTGTDGAACEASEDEALIDFAAMSTARKVLTNDLKALHQGQWLPIHTRYGLAETGRATSSGPNIMNWNGKVEGIREVFVPRPGRLYIECDYPQLELYTLAQCCMTWFGRSELAKVLLAGKDPHKQVAATIGGMTYEALEALVNNDDPHGKRLRGFAKIENFGRPGGLSDKSSVEYAKRSMPLKDFVALNYTTDVAAENRKAWLATFPEMVEYFNRIRALCKNDENRATVTTLFTERTRGNATFCAACNNGFQALGSDCAKRAACIIARAQYVQGGRYPALFGSRTVAFVHDEFIAEADEATAAEAAEALADVMCDGANEYLPNVPMARSRFEPLLMARWSKKAKTVRDTNGRLVVWQPKAKEVSK